MTACDHGTAYWQKSWSLPLAFVLISLNFLSLYHDLVHLEWLSETRNQLEEASFGVPLDLSLMTMTTTTTNRVVVKSIIHTSQADQLYVPEETLLTVPFYVYPELMEIVNQATYGAQNISVHETVANALAFGSHKHDDDYHFIQSALKHPMRASDPSSARLFVVPVLFNLAALAYQYRDSMTHEGLCYVDNRQKNGGTKKYCNDQLLEYVDQLLGQSPYFQEHHGRDHMTTLPFFHWDALLQVYKFSNLRNCSALTFGDVPIPLEEGRLSLPTMYVGNPCDLEDANTTTNKVHDFALVATLRSGPKYRFRKRICDWIGPHGSNNNNNDDSNNVSMAFCGTGPQCPTLAQSRFGFHVRGDSHSSNRLFDTLLSGTVPIFTTQKQYWAVPDWIDWDQLSYFVNMLAIEKDEVMFQANITVIRDDAAGYYRRHRAVLDNRPLFNWTSGTPFDMYMYRLQVALWPKLQARSSRFSALQLS